MYNIKNIREKFKVMEENFELYYIKKNQYLLLYHSEKFIFCSLKKMKKKTYLHNGLWKCSSHHAVKFDFHISFLFSYIKF